MPNPHRLGAIERIDELQHIADNAVLRVVLVACVYGGFAVAAQVGRDGSKSKLGERR